MWMDIYTVSGPITERLVLLMLTVVLLESFFYGSYCSF